MHSLAANLFVELSWEMLSGHRMISDGRSLLPSRAGDGETDPGAGGDPGFLHSFSKCVLRSAVCQALVHGSGQRVNRNRNFPAFVNILAEGD